MQKAGGEVAGPGLLLNARPRFQHVCGAAQFSVPKPTSSTPPPHPGAPLCPLHTSSPTPASPASAQVPSSPPPATPTPTPRTSPCDSLSPFSPSTLPALSSQHQGAGFKNADQSVSPSCPQAVGGLLWPWIHPDWGGMPSVASVCSAARSGGATRGSCTSCEDPAPAWATEFACGPLWVSYPTLFNLVSSYISFKSQLKYFFKEGSFFFF